MPEARAFSDSVGCLVIKPDCVLRGLVRATLCELIKEKFEVLAFRIGRMPAALLFQMNGASGRVEVDDWRFNARLHEFGPSICLLLRSNTISCSEVQANAQARLRSLKGGALPTNFGLDTLRTKVGALNRVFNLLHCPDTPTEAIETLAVWMPGAIDQFFISSKATKSVTEEIECHGYLGEYLDPAALVVPLHMRLQHAATWRKLDNALVRQAEAILERVASGEEIAVGGHSFLMGIFEIAGVFVSALESYVLETAQRYPVCRLPLDSVALD